MLTMAHVHALSTYWSQLRKVTHAYIHRLIARIASKTMAFVELSPTSTTPKKYDDRFLLLEMNYNINR